MIGATIFLAVITAFVAYIAIGVQRAKKKNLRPDEDSL